MQAAATLLVLPLLATAAGDAVLHASVDEIATADWRVTNLEARIELTDAGIRARVDIGRVALPDASLELVYTSIDCAHVRLSASRFACDDGALTADFPALGRHSVPVQFAYDRTSGTTQFTLPRLPVAGAALQVRGSAADTGIELRFDGQSLSIESLVAIANSFDAGIEDLATSGTVAVAGSVASRADGSLRLSLETRLDGVSVANAAGTAVGDGVHGRLQLDAARTDSGWRIDADLHADQGEAYFEPVYANLTEHALHVSVTGLQTADFVALAIPAFRVEQASLLTLEGGLTLTLPGGGRESTHLTGRIEFRDTAVDAVYTSLLQVLAAGTLFGDLETAGRVAGHITFHDDALGGAELEFEDVSLDDRQRRFAVFGLNGRVHWPGPGAEAAGTPPSYLQWDSAAAYDIALGGARIDARIGGDDLELLEPLRIATLGGAFRINRLAMHDYGSDAASGLLDAELEPIQLGQLTGAFGWPAFSGSLSGRLPLLQYEGNAMTVGGRLTARAFDGDIEVDNLRVERPFGRVPRLYGDIRMRNLDLERVTNTFSFGLIQGRLSGDVTGLQMLDWSPVAMDLHVYTPSDDNSRRRISQRAVENLASVGGGGAAAALSSGLLKFFEVFAYERIGLRCVLQDGVCAMSGAGAAGDGPLGRGYYIVKGSGLPRIDVIGYRSKVSWQSLVNQLENITQSAGPVVN